MPFFSGKKDINLLGIIAGFIYGLIALGSYFTPHLIYLLGLMRFEDAIRLQDVLFHGYQFHFALLGLLFVVETGLLYLKRKAHGRFEWASLSLHSMYFTSLFLAFILTYLLVSWSLNYLI